jgi:hypothetical protein
MLITLKGFTQDSDVDFILTPQTDAERVLLKAMRARTAKLVFTDPANMTMTVRATVRGERTD